MSDYQTRIQLEKRGIKTDNLNKYDLRHGEQLIKQHKQDRWLEAHGRLDYQTGGSSLYPQAPSNHEQPVNRPAISNDLLNPTVNLANFTASPDTGLIVRGRRRTSSGMPIGGPGAQQFNFGGGIG